MHQELPRSSEPRRQSDIDSQRDGGGAQKEKTRLDEGEERSMAGKRRDFKGLREQMANCTRVSQPGSKSVLCIRMGGGRGRRMGTRRELGG